MRPCWISAAVAVANWLALFAYFLTTDYATNSNGTFVLQFWGVYAALALVVSGLVATRHPELARLIAVPLFIFTPLSPFFVGLLMLPSSLAALVLAVWARNEPLPPARFGR